MSLLSYTDLIGLINQKVITNVTSAEVNSTSIDISLGGDVLFETPGLTNSTIFLKNRESLYMTAHSLSKEPYRLYPGEFVLAHSQQVFNLPSHISAEYKLKSSMARCGLEHLNAGWCDAGWNGSVLTLELKNMTRNHILVLEEGMPIGQMVFFSHLAVPESKSYAVRGRYNGDLTVKGIKE